MHISPDEAQQSLAMIRTVTQQTRRAISSGGGAYFMILWGIIWFLGFLASQFLPEATAGMLWGILDVLGCLLSAGLGRQISKRFRSGTPPYDRQFGLFWLALFAFASLSIWIGWPWSDRQIALFIILVVMFGYVIMGIWVESWPLSLTGIGVIGLALVGYYLLPAYFSLWMAGLGGGTLTGMGLYILRSWK